MASPELVAVSREIRSGLGEAVGQLRQASTANSSLLGKVVKDIATMFASQRRNIMDMSNNLSEYFDENIRTTSKLQELLSLQNSIIAELRNISGNIRILGETQVAMQNNIIRSINSNGSQSLVESIIGNAGGNLLSGLAGLIPGFAKELIGFGLGAAAGYFGNELLKKFGLGFGGGDSLKTMGQGGSYKESNQFYDAIIKSEGTGKTGDPYNTSLGYLKSPKPLTQMTMDEALQWGDQIRTGSDIGRRTNSSAKGAFQIVNTTQKLAMAALGLKGSDPFNEENQRKMASWIAHKQGLGAWEGLKIHPDQMQIASQAMASGTDRDFSSKVLEQNMPAEAAGSSNNQTATKEKPSSADAPRTDADLLHHKDDASGKLSGVQPGILSKFEQIQSQSPSHLTVTSGFRSVAHNAAVGGAQNSAHTRGNAVDVSFPANVDQTIKLINIASAAGIGGIGVYRPGLLHFDTEGKRAWGPSYHADSIPAWAQDAIQKHLGTGGSGKSDGEGGGQDAAPAAQNAPSGKDMAQEANLQAARQLLGLGGGPSMQSGGGGPGAMMGGMMPMGMGAGGMLGALMPVASMLLSSLASPAAAADLAPPQQMSRAPNTVVNNQTVMQAAIEKQARQEKSTEREAPPQQVNQGSQIAPNQYAKTDQGFAYNPPWDHGWMDWGQLIGGNHWKELSNFKTHMW